LPDAAFVLSTLARRGLLNPGRPDRVARQLTELRHWGLSLVGELRSAAARDPGRTAVVDDHRRLTYAELDERVRRLAHAFMGGYGLGPGDRIAVLCRNSVAMLEAVAAAGALGADAVLVNTGLGPSQLDAVTRREHIRLLVHDDEFFELLAAVPPAVHRVSADGDARRPSPTVAGLVDSAPADDLPPPARPGRTIVLTSGTTGAPKGARRPVPPGFGPLAALLSRMPVRVGERAFVAAPLFHTWGYAGMQIALAVRGTIVLRRRFDPVTMLQAVSVERCGALFAVPVMLERLLDVPRPARPPLRIVASSGSSLPGGLATRFMDAYGDVLYNLYGSTEASWASIATPPELRRDPSCAGRPPRGTRVVVVGADGQPVPQGVIGSILVGNEMLFEGYTDGGAHGRGTGRTGLLDTGDLGHVTPDGLLRVDGREDDMVVSGGENVYPSAVEDLLAALPQVREVAVAGVPDHRYGQRLAAWIVLHPGERLDGDAVREYVRRHLARFSVPRDVHYLAELPRNATGKVLVRRLKGTG
jgi:acyl-CoA synthetase (AMP-forming)/AMP-acid ligase II